jgi:hypothetical protein
MMVCSTATGDESRARMLQHEVATGKGCSRNSHTLRFASLILYLLQEKKLFTVQEKW